MSELWSSTALRVFANFLNTSGDGETPTKKRKRAPKSEVKVDDEDEEGKMLVLHNNDTSDNEGAVGGKAVKKGVPA